MDKKRGVTRLDARGSAPRLSARSAVPGYGPEPGQTDELVVELAPRKSALAHLMELIEDFGMRNSVSEAAVYRVNLEVDELLTNYVVHRRPAEVPARMVVRVRIVRRCLVLVVADTGPPFDPESVAPLSEAPDRSVELGGAGLHLVRSYADRLHYRELDGCNILRLEHDLEPAPKGGRA